jgi:hypothetical protein
VKFVIKKFLLSKYANFNVNGCYTLGVYDLR